MAGPSGNGASGPHRWAGLTASRGEAHAGPWESLGLGWAPRWSRGLDLRRARLTENSLDAAIKPDGIRKVRAVRQGRRGKLIRKQQLWRLPVHVIIPLHL